MESNSSASPNKNALPNEGHNRYQVGGDHYGLIKFQHWDYVAVNKMDYFVAQITRYVVRYDKKEGVKDIEKALHYYNKLKELIKAGILSYPAAREAVKLKEFADANNLTPLQYKIFLVASTYQYPENLGLLYVLLNELLAKAKRLQEKALEKAREEASGE